MGAVLEYAAAGRRLMLALLQARGPAPYAWVLFWAIMIPCFLSPLTVWVTGENLEVRLGVGILEKTIPPGEIKSSRSGVSSLGDKESPSRNGCCGGAGEVLSSGVWLDQLAACTRRTARVGSCAADDAGGLGPG